ncbi:MAG: hypothetical protein Kow0059_18850 [Candidatus Sumerlaeia bacterium]
MSEKSNKLPIECCTIDHTIVIRVEGRATFKHAAPLKDYFDRLLQRDEPCEVIIDLNRCDTLDSTFLGILAGMSTSMKKKGWSRICLVNMNSTIQRLVKIIGLDRVVSTYPPLDLPEGEQVEYVQLDAGDKSMDRKQQILFMLDAHKQLLPLDEGNELRFKNLMACLNESLEQDEK